MTSKWDVVAWVTAPGDFPAASVAHVRVSALNARDAITRARARLLVKYIEPVNVVEVRRVDPPAMQAP